MRIEHRIRMHVLAALVLLLFIGPPLISLFTSQTIPQFQIAETSPIPGEVGYSITNSVHVPERNITIYSGNILDDSADWILADCQDQSDLDERGIESVQKEDDGIHVQLAGYHEYEYHYYNSEAMFAGRPCFPVMNYNEAQFSVALNIVSGTVGVSLRVLFKDNSVFEWSEDAETNLLLEAGDNETIALVPDLGVINSITEGMSVDSVILVEVTSEIPAEVVIGEVKITANSDEDLYPITFDIQAPDGESLFSNEYTNRLGGRFREMWGSSSFTGWDISLPALWLTNTGNASDSTLLFIRKTNETFYLREGTYSGSAGWAKIDTNYGFGSLVTAFNITIVVSSGEAIYVQVKILATRLSLTLHPDFAYVRVHIYADQYGEYFYIIDYPLKSVEYLYLPPLAGLNVTVGPLQYDYRQNDVAHRSYSQQNRFSVAVSKALDSNIEVSFVFAEFEVFGFIFDFGFIVAIAALVGIISFVPLAIYENRAWREPSLQPSLFPLSITFVSIFTPWIEYSFLTGAYPETKIYGDVFIPVLTTLWSSPGSSIAIAPSSYLLPNILLLAVLYWLPIGYLFNQIVRRKKVISVRQLSEADSMIVIDILLGPFLLGIYYLYLCLTGLCSITIGLIVTLAILPAWIMAKAIEDRRTSETAERT